MQARLSFQNNRESDPELRARFPGARSHAPAASCRRGHRHGPVRCPPRRKRRACRCGRRTGLYLNPDAEMWENPAWVPAQPQPLCGPGGFLKGRPELMYPHGWDPRKKITPLLWAGVSPSIKRGSQNSISPTPQLPPLPEPLWARAVTSNTCAQQAKDLTLRWAVR